MSGQLLLPGVSDTDLWQSLLEEIRDIVRLRTTKEVAFGLDVSPSELSHALAERNRYDLKLRYLPYLLRARGTDELPRIIVEHCGLSLGEPKPMSAAERLERLEAAALRSGPAGQAILDEAYGRRRR